jgi:hypothetical protein
MASKALKAIRISQPAQRGLLGQPVLLGLPALPALRSCLLTTAAPVMRTRGVGWRRLRRGILLFYKTARYVTMRFRD